jgi:hypothetical protein
LNKRAGDSLDHEANLLALGPDHPHTVLSVHNHALFLW